MKNCLIILNILLSYKNNSDGYVEKYIKLKINSSDHSSLKSFKTTTPSYLLNIFQLQ